MGAVKYPLSFQPGLYTLFDVVRDAVKSMIVVRMPRAYGAVWSNPGMTVGSQARMSCVFSYASMLAR